MRGQGIVEYILIFILIAVVVIVVLALLGPTMGNIMRDMNRNVCTGTIVECQLARVDECMATERLTEDQCVTLVGGK